MKSSVRSAALIVTVVALALGGTIPFASAQGSKEKPQATEIGVTAKEIRIAILADVDTPVAPGLFRGSQDAIEGFEKYINKAGGLAGRKVVVDFIDTKLSADEARNAVIKACSERLRDGRYRGAVPQQRRRSGRLCRQGGRGNRSPRHPVRDDRGRQQQCSPITFPVSPPQVLCDTDGRAPADVPGECRARLLLQEEVRQRPPWRLHLRQRPEVGAQRVVLERSRPASPGRAASRTATSICRRVPHSPSTRPWYRRSRTTVVDLRTERRAVQHDGRARARRRSSRVSTSVKVWDCGTQCYDPSSSSRAVPMSRGSTSTLCTCRSSNAGGPQGEQDGGELLQERRRGQRRTARRPRTRGSAGDRVPRRGRTPSSKEHGVNGLTRANLLAALEDIHEFDADGLLRRRRPRRSGDRPVSCALQVKNGKFVRVQPTKAGTFDCPKGGVVHTELDLIQS